MSKATVRTPVVEFSRGPAASDDGQVVRRKGVIFRAGEYSHQRFSMSPDELRALAASFAGPIPIDHGHPTTDGPIDFGRLESVEASPDGTTLYGTTATPAWLDKALGDARWLVSASFDRATKAIRRLSLVTRPQISDAELQAAFACACGHEAVTETPAKERPLMTKKEQALARLAEMDDESVFDAILDDTPPDDDIDTGEAAEAETSDFAMEDDPEKAELRARLSALEDERRRERSASFASAEVAANRILPHEQDAAAAVMFQALQDDAILEDTVNFSVGGKAVRGTREAMVRAAYGQRTPHQWTEERVASFGRGRALDNGAESGETEEQRRKRIDARLANTSLGKAALARRNGAARV